MLFNESYITDMTTLLEKSEKELSKNKLDFKTISNEIKDKGKSAISLIKNFVYKIYKQSPESLASDLPSISQLVRLTITVGIPIAINPLIGIFTLLVDKVLSDSASARDIDKYISYYEKQIARTEKDIVKANGSDKKYLEAHLSDLEKGLTNLNDKKYKLEDEEDSILGKLGKKQDSLNEAFKELSFELNLLTEEQISLLFDDTILEAGIIDKVKKNASMGKKIVKQKEEQMDRWFNKTLKEIQGETRNKSREDIVENSLPKLSKMIKRAIALGVTWAINPAIAAITAMTMITTSKYTTEKEKKRVLSELKKELEIVEEKIKDADSNGDRKEKYELIRLRQKLTTDIDRIKKYI